MSPDSLSAASSRRGQQHAILWSAAVFVVALAATMLLIWFKFDAWKPTYWIAICVAPSSAIALIVAHLVRHDPSRMRSLAQRFTLSVLLTLGPIAFAAWASARMMGITPGDAIVVSAVLVMALAVGARISYGTRLLNTLT